MTEEKAVPVPDPLGLNILGGAELERLVSGLSETTGRNLLGDAVTTAYDL